MLKPNDAETILDSSPNIRLARPKEIKSAVYINEKGNYLALERQLKTVAKVHIEPTIDPNMIGLSKATFIEHLTPSVIRVHLPVTSLKGPYQGRSGNEAWRIKLASEADLRILLVAYGK